MLLPFRSTDRKSGITTSWLSMPAAWLSVPVAILVFLLLSSPGCPRTSTPTHPTTSSQPTYVPPKNLGEVPSRPLSRLTPSSTQWASPVEPGLTRMIPVEAPQSTQAVAEPEEHWGCLVHHVRGGESLSTIVKKYYGRGGAIATIKDRNPQAFNDKDALLAEAPLYLPTSPLRSKNGRLTPPGQIPDAYITARGDTPNKIAGWLSPNPRIRKTIINLNGLSDSPDGVLTPGTKLILRLPTAQSAK